MEKFSLKKFNSVEIKTETLHRISGGTPTAGGCEFSHHVVKENKCGLPYTVDIYIRWDSDNSEGGRCGVTESTQSCITSGC